MMQSNNGNARARYYWHDLKALIDGRGNHPSIYQWDTFNEQDMMHDFNTSNVVKWCASAAVISLSQTRHCKLGTACCCCAAL